MKGSAAEAPAGESTANLLRWVGGFLRPHLAVVLLAQVLIALSAGLGLLWPWLIKDAFDRIILSGDLRALLRLTGALVLLQIILAVVNGLRGYCIAWVGNHVLKDLRASAYQRLHELAFGVFAASKTGDLIARVIGDVGRLQTAVTQGVASLLQQIVTLVLGAAIMLRLDWQLAILSFVLLPLVLLLTGTLGTRLRRVSRQVQEKLGVITSLVQETVAGMEVIRTLVLRSLFLERFDRENRQVFSKALLGTKVRVLVQGLIGFLNACTYVAVIAYGGYRAILGYVTPGELIACVLYIDMIRGPLSHLMNMYVDVQQALGAAERVRALYSPRLPVERNCGITITKCSGAIEFREVSFQYPSELTLVGEEDMEGNDSKPPTIRGVSFCIQPGQKVALVGPSGAGKTTIVKLLLGLYRPDRGEILIDGQPLSQINLWSFRRHIGIVPQETFLFDGTIKDNISIAKPDAPMIEIEAAARTANIHEFVRQLPEGYNTKIGERGVRLSGGERQRLAIARLVLYDPSILIFDEATAFLDSEAQNLVQTGLERVMRGRTTIMVAHRLSTVTTADLIMVMEKGTIVETGTHEQLLRQGGRYANLWHLQFAHSQTA